MRPAEAGEGNDLPPETPVRTPETPEEFFVFPTQKLPVFWCLWCPAGVSGGRPLLLRSCFVVAFATQLLGRILPGDRDRNVRRRGEEDYLPPETPVGHQKHQRNSLFFGLKNFLSSGVFGVRTGGSGGRLGSCSPRRCTASPRWVRMGRFPFTAAGSSIEHRRRCSFFSPSSASERPESPGRRPICHNGARSHDLQPPGVGRRDVIRTPRHPTAPIMTSIS